MTAAFVLGFIAGLVIAALVMWLAVKEIEGIQMSNAPRYRLVGYDIGTAPDENGGWVHWTDHEAEIARLTADLAESRAYALAQFFAGKMSKKPERIWSRPDYNECWHKRLEEEDVEYVRADLYAAKSAEIARLTAERDYDRKQSEHKSSVIDKLNATIASAAEKAEAERDAALAGAVKVKPLVWEDAAEMLAKEMQAIVAADRWKGRDLSYTPPEKWSHLRPETQKFWIDTAARILASIQPAPEVRQEALAKAYGPILDLLPDAVLAAGKAMRKYPQPNYVISKWAEETGEVTKDLIHMAEGRQTADKLRGEIVQSLAMLHRLMVEGDQVHGLPPVGPQIRALTPPADLAAKIGGE